MPMCLPVTIIVLHHGAPRHRGRREGRREAHRRSALILHAHFDRHRAPRRVGHHVRCVVAIATRGQHDLGALGGFRHTRVRQNVADHIVHGVQVVEDDRDRGIAGRKLRRDRRGHRHHARHALRCAVDHGAEAIGGGAHHAVALFRRLRHQQRFVQAHLQPVIRPDQAVELGIVLAEGERVRHFLHELHALGLRAEREIAARQIRDQNALRLGVLRGLVESPVRPDVVDLPVQNVRPFEHHLRFGRHTRVRRHDRFLRQRQARRIDQQLLREEVELARLEARYGLRGGLRPQHFVENGVPVVERIEHLRRVGIDGEEAPVPASTRVELLGGGDPLRLQRCGRAKRRETDREGQRRASCA
jgi:hypothetical protein